MASIPSGSQTFKLLTKASVQCTQKSTVSTNVLVEEKEGCDFPSCSTIVRQLRCCWGPLGSSSALDQACPLTWLLHDGTSDYEWHPELPLLLQRLPNCGFRRSLKWEIKST